MNDSAPTAASAPTPRRARVRAPELIGKGGWLNTGGKQLTLADLRGSIVILDFWTFCCVNCLHVLDELRGLEERHKIGRASCRERVQELGGAGMWREKS